MHKKTQQKHDNEIAVQNTPTMERPAKGSALARVSAGFPKYGCAFKQGDLPVRPNGRRELDQDLVLPLT